MGGRGSGGHNSKGKLRDVQCARLDVHELAREGKLKLGTQGLLFGTIWFEVAGGPDAQRLVLEFPRSSASGEPLDPVRQVIGCHWRKGHFGGRYLMFLCGECHRPARVLYARYTGQHHRIWFFSCRKCAGITYQSTMGHRWDRSARRVEKLRAQLQWGAGDTVPVKPRGMHEKTYQRIWGCLPTTRLCESRARVTLENPCHISTVLICGDNAETDLRALADGRFAEFVRRPCHLPDPTATDTSARAMAAGGGQSASNVNATMPGGPGTAYPGDNPWTGPAPIEEILARRDRTR